MRRADVRRAIAIAAMLFLAGCGSSPKTAFFTLTPVPPETGKATAAIKAPVTVAAVNLPPSLDRSEMVRRTGATTVDIDSAARWTAPLADMTRTVLSQDLAARLPKEKLILPDSPAPQNTAQIVVTIAEFGPAAESGTTLQGSWSLVKGVPAKPVLQRDFDLDTDASAVDGSSQAAAMSRRLARLADNIAAALPGAL
jgi:uncharacterized lipoprotein YmbA